MNADKESDGKYAIAADASGGDTHHARFDAEETGRDTRAIEELRARNRYLEDIRKATVNILEDITESENELRKKTEELQKFRQAVDLSFDNMIITDDDGVILYANHAAEVMTGYRLDEIVGKTPALWGKQMSKEFYRTMWRTIKDEKQRYAGEVTNRRKDGKRYLTSVRITPILDDTSEQVKFFVGVGRDITEERKAQLQIMRHAAELETANASIAEQKNRTEAILRFLKSIGEGVFAVDAEGRIVFMNETAELMSGRLFNDVEHHPVADVFSFVREKQSVPEPFPIIEMTFSKKRTTAFPEQSFLVRSGKRIPISGTCSLIRDERQEVIGAIAVFQDVTKKHELDQLKDSFLSVAAHQLRTPLGSMRWSMELLLNGDLGELPDEAKEVLGQIYENSQRMTTLVNDLLDVSRIDQNRGHEEKKPVDLGGLLMDVVRTLSPEAEKHAVAISMALPSDSLPAIMAPPKHLYEAMENIVSNAIKYNRNENGKVHIAAEDIGRAVLITVSDNGIGIPKKDQSKIFSKFFRASNALLRETEGSGLGLSVVKSYIEESGAQVWFESEEGHGTKFFVKFPLVPTDS